MKYNYDSKTKKVTDQQGNPVLIKDPEECETIECVVGEAQKIMDMPDQMFIDIFKEIHQEENIQEAMKWFT